ncbi:Drug resistance transporter, EmrB/QacA family [Desulfosporosinus sp. I2]|nr:Drug resistance transporter, EmrB/QacA family [Desulfosporosinus sp. I2]
MFVLQERRADEPIMPLQIWQDPLIVVSNLATLRGVATASNMFMNILGSTMGAALLGGVLNIKLTNYLRGLSGDTLNVNVINVLLDPIKRGALPNDVLNMMTLALATSLNFVFWGLLVVAALSLSLVLFFPNKDKVTT